MNKIVKKCIKEKILQYQGIQAKLDSITVYDDFSKFTDYEKKKEDIIYGIILLLLADDFLNTSNGIRKFKELATMSEKEILILCEKCFDELDISN